MEPLGKKSLHVLLVEDNDDYAYALTRTLNAHYRIDHASTETEALRMLYIDDYDVLLLDLTLAMGYLSGFRLLDYIKHQPRFQNLKIIALSGMATEDVRSNPSFEKLSAFLTKPVSVTALVETIERCTSGSTEIIQPDTSEKAVHHGQFPEKF